MPDECSRDTGPTPSDSTMSELAGGGCSQELISSAEASPAKTSPWLARVPASTEPGLVFGGRCSESFASYDPGTSSWRTSQRSLLGGSETFSEAWPRAGTMRSGIASRRSPLAPLTDVIASSSWGTASLPTPQVADSWSGCPMNADGRDRVNSLTGRPQYGMLPTPSATPYGSNQGGSMGRDGQPVRPSLDTMAAMGLLPTPTSGDSRNSRNATAARSAPDSKHHGGWTLSDVAYAGLLPTPTKADAERTSDTYCRGNPTLHGAVGGKLHPQFVEWMMSFPIGWTVCDASEMPSSPK